MTIRPFHQNDVQMSCSRNTNLATVPLVAVAVSLREIVLYGSVTSPLMNGDKSGEL